MRALPSSPPSSVHTARPNTVTRPLGYLLAPLVLAVAVLFAQLVSAVTR